MNKKLLLCLKFVILFLFLTGFTIFASNLGQTNSSTEAGLRYTQNNGSDNTNISKTEIEHPFAGKTIVFIGDSWLGGLGWQTQENLSPEDRRGFSYILKEKNPTAKVFNYAIAGATFSMRADTYNDILYQYFDLAKSKMIPDYVFIDGGANDFLNAIAMGDIQKGYTPSKEYLENMSGALEYLLYGLQMNYPKSKIGYIIPTKFTNDLDASRIYFDRCIEICQKWGISVLDLAYEGGLNPNVSEMKNDYYNDDVHPNQAGYRRVYSIFDAWAKGI